MRTDRIRRLLPLSGLLFAAVLMAGLVLTRGEADAGAAQATIYAYWHDHYGVQLLSSILLIPLAAVFLLVFAAEVRRTIRSCEAGEAVYSTIALAGGIMAAVGLGVTGTLNAAVATAAHHHASAAVYTLAQLQSYDWVPWIAGFAAMFLGIGIGSLRTVALPKALAIPALGFGIAFLTPLGFFALFALPFWFAAAGIVLFRRNGSTEVAGAHWVGQPA
jgi:hypothetical protein